MKDSIRLRRQSLIVGHHNQARLLLAHSIDQQAEHH